MGMDVFGKAPTAKTGEYFRRNVWGWRPLAELVVELCPAAAGCRYWQSNDGDGLDAAGAARLADELDAALADGRAQKWISTRNAAVGVMPNESCRFCLGTGIRDGWCNGCDGRGWNPPTAASYGVDADDVREFANFARASGGFQIL